MFSPLYSGHKVTKMLQKEENWQYNLTVMEMKYVQTLNVNYLLYLIYYRFKKITIIIIKADIFGLPVS